jgi:hypothetical protein
LKENFECTAVRKIRLLISRIEQTVQLASTGGELSFDDVFCVSALELVSRVLLVCEFVLRVRRKAFFTK